MFKWFWTIFSLGAPESSFTVVQNGSVRSGHLSPRRLSSLFINRRVLVRTRSSLHDRVIQLPQDFYTVSPVAEIGSIWFSRPFCLFSILSHKNQKFWLFFFYVNSDWWIARKRTGPRTHCYRGTCHLPHWRKQGELLNEWLLIPTIFMCCSTSYIVLIVCLF